MNLLDQILQLMRPQIQTQHSGNYGGSQGAISPEEARMIAAQGQLNAPPAKRAEPALLAGLYRQMLQPGFEMPVPYSHDMPRQSVSQWTPAAQASLIQLLMQQRHKGK